MISLTSMKKTIQNTNSYNVNIYVYILGQILRYLNREDKYKSYRRHLSSNHLHRHDRIMPLQCTVCPTLYSTIVRIMPLEP